MKKIASALAIAAALGLPAMAQAKPVTLTVQMKQYSGNRAYLALYLVDAKGVYKDTLWVSGGKTKYYRHLIDWTRLSGRNLSGINGITGASIGSGRTLKVTVDLADALIDAGYQLHIDAAVEDYRESPSEIVAPLNSGNAGKAYKGRRYISNFKLDL
jgi:hypothetical protein